MRFKDIRIPAKIAGISFTLSLIGVAFVVFLSWKMRDIDVIYSDLLDNQAQTSISLARSMTRLQQMGYNATRAVVFFDDPKVVKDAEDNFTDASKKINENLQRAVELLPAKAKEVADLRKLADQIKDLGRKAIDTAKVGRTDTAQGFIKTLDDILDKGFDKTAGVLKDINDVTRTRSVEATRDITFHSYLFLALSIAAGVLGMVATLLMSSKTITGPLARLQGRMGELASGDLSVEVEGQDRGDEIGAMAKAVQVFKTEGLRARALEQDATAAREAADAERARTEAERKMAADEQARVVRMLGDNLAKLAHGDLTARLADFPPAYVQLQEDFNEAIEKLEEAMTAVLSNSNAINAGSTEVAQASDDLSQRTEQQAANLEETAAALEEITATVATTAQGAKHAHSVVSSTKTHAEQSAMVVERAVSAMSEIEKSAGEIGKIIGVIDEIAFQTNLLALNAGVEAARAGDAGRGFAVVASEVRALAQRSAEAAKEIKTLISKSTNQVSTGVELVDKTGEALKAIAVQVSEISGIVSEIAASAQEQATGLTQVNTAVNQMDQITQQNAAMVEQSTAASHSLRKEAKELVSLVSRFRVTAEPAQAINLAERRPAPRKQPAPARVARSMESTARKLQPAADEWEDF